MGPAADQVATAEDPADLEILDLAIGHLGIPGLRRRLAGFAAALGHLGQQVLFLKTVQSEGHARRGRHRLLDERTSIDSILGHSVIPHS